MNTETTTAEAAPESAARPRLKRRGAKRKANPRREHLAFRATTDEALAYQLDAANAGKGLSDWIRDACRAAIFPPKGG